MEPASERLKQFVEAVKDKDYWEIIDFAAQEATQAERAFFQRKKSGHGDPRAMTRYATILKDLISFVRYGVKPPGVETADFRLFQSICEGLAHKKQTYSRG